MCIQVHVNLIPDNYANPFINFKIINNFYIILFRFKFKIKFFFNENNIFIY